jgi:hypothetical protein
MGAPRSPAGTAHLEKQSPLNSAGKIRTPLMVVQGANDPRVNKAESDQIVIALRDRKFPVEYIVAPDEGHGFARPVNNMAMMAAAEKFLAKYLGGRYQEDMTPEVGQRLKEITVDPKTVVLAKKVAASVGSPKPALPMQPGTYKYQAKMEMGGQSMALNLSTEIKDENGAWTATDRMTGPMGEATDTTVLNKDSLVVEKRSIKQGPVNIQLAFRDNNVTGTMNMKGQERPVSMDTGGPLFADSAGAPQSIACLPLADGFSTTYRNFDVEKQKVKLMQLQVAGSEKVTVPAGTFDAFKTDITSGEGGPEKITVWIAKDSRKPVKISAVLPQMGGAVLTAELAE